MLTPYDWQEGISNRASFIESRLVQGTPILALSIPAGIVIFTYRRQNRKLYEVYERLGFAGLGQQSDIETLRQSAIDFAHQEGFQRSEKDVTLRRVLSALSAPMKRAFADFSAAPFVVKGLFVEVGESVEQDVYAILNYDGDYNVRDRYAYVSGAEENNEKIKAELNGLLGQNLTAETAYAALKTLWEATFVVERPEGTAEECLFIARETSRITRFQRLSPDDGQA
jgi:proteasome alpha subunit